MKTKKEKAPQELCQSRVAPSGTFGSFHSRTCGKPAKGHLENGKPACGIHLRAEATRIARNAKFNADWRVRSAFADEVEAFAVKHDIGPLLTTHSDTRRVSISFDVLTYLVDKIARLEEPTCGDCEWFGVEGVACAIAGPKASDGTCSDFSPDPRRLPL